jgi:probable rRNA maturation factor
MRSGRNGRRAPGRERPPSGARRHRLARRAVTIINEQDRLPLDGRRLRRLVLSALRREDSADDDEQAKPDGRSVTVLVSGHARLSDLCRRFLGRPRRTDVLAFPAGDDEPPKGEHGEGHLGDVVVNADRAVREARRRGIAPEAELFLYVVHGLLHLVGYDDRSPEKTRRMRRREAEVLRRFGYAAVFEAPARRTAHKPRRGRRGGFTAEAQRTPRRGGE